MYLPRTEQIGLKMRWFWLLSVCLLLHLTVFATLSSSGYISTPWYLKNRISIPTFQNETTLIDATTNSTHIFVLDSDFQLHLFSGSDNQNNNSLAHVTSYNLSYPIGAYVCCLDWFAWRNVTASALSYNPYNGYLYLAKYVLLDRIRLKLYRFRAEDVSNITFFDYDYRDLAINYFQTSYANPRVTFHFDETSLFATIYNEPTESMPQMGFFIARMTYNLFNIAYVFRTDETALTIDFGCHNAYVVCVLTKSATTYEYTMLNFTFIQSYSTPASVNVISFDPKVVKLSNDVRLYGSRKPNNFNTFSISQFNTTYSKLASLDLPYVFDFPYNGTNYDMESTSSGMVIVGTTTNSSVGLGDTDIIISGFDSDLNLNARLLFSTAKQDNLSNILVQNEADLIIIGSTDGNVSDPLQSLPSRELFISYFGYLGISNITSSKPNGVIWGDIVQIFFASLPVEAFSATPLVTFNEQPCTGIVWSGQRLLATIPPGVGGPYDLVVHFQYLSYSNDSSSAVFPISYVPVVRDVQPTEGPAVGFDVVIQVDYLGTAGLDPVEVTIGKTRCLNIVQLNASTVSCSVPPGIGRNHAVTVSLGPKSNSTETFFVSFEPPTVTDIIPANGTTSGGNTIEIIGKNFGFCQNPPCDSSRHNVSVQIGSQPCGSVLLHSDGYVTCVVASGSGANHSVNVVVASQNSTTIPQYSYNRPEITSILPPFLVSANPTLFIDGANFGNVSDIRSVAFIDVSNATSYTCPSLIWLAQERLRCNFSTTSIPLLSTFNISVVVTNQSNIPSSTAQFFTFIPNTKPVALPYNVTIYEDQFIMIDLIASDPDIGDTVQLFVVSMPTNGSLYQVTSTNARGAIINTTLGRVAVTNSQNKVMYVPNSDFYGLDSFLFMAKDSQNAESVVQTASITLLPLDDPPKIQNMVISLDEDTNTSFVLPVFDPDTPDSNAGIQLTISSLPSKGNLYFQNSTTQTFDLIQAIPHVLEESNLTLMFSPITNEFGNPYSSFTYKANDGGLDSVINATVMLVVNPVNDPPIFNTTLVENLTVYEDTDIIIPMDVTDVDLSDVLSVKITNIHINGTLFRVDKSTGARTSQTVGEGSEIPGPPYQIYFVPASNFYSESVDSYQWFNVTYSDGKLSFTQRIEFPVLAVNDRPVITCPGNVFLPSDVLIGTTPSHPIQLIAADVDDVDLEFHLLAAPERGYLNASVPLTSDSIFTTANLTFYPNNTGGVYPYGNFTIFATDKSGGVSNYCTFFFRFSCPPAKYNNIYGNGTGPICAPCLDGADCSQDGSSPPKPRYGYWQSNNSTFLQCFPVEACPGGDNRCATGYAGDRCGSCAKKYYRLNNECKLCHDDRTTQIVLIAICLLIGTLMMYGFLRIVGKGPNYGLANILINFIQYVLILRELRLNWPPELHIILNTISFINFNIELTSPECLWETSLNYGMKMKLTLAIPIVLAVDLFLFRSVGVLYKALRGLFGLSTEQLIVRREDESKKTSPFLVAVRVFNSLLSIVFATVTTKALGLFDCTLENDGFYYLDADNSVKCYSDDWYKEVPFAIAGIMVYVIGIPLYFSIMLLLLYQTKYDGPAWKNGKRIVSKVMDYDRIYKDERQAFVVVQLFQKLALIIISMFFTRHTGLQVVLTQTVLLISLILYLKYKPYNYTILNILEIGSTVCSVLVLGLGLPFHIDNFKSSSQTGLIIVMLFLIFAFIFAVICASIYELQSKVRERVKSFRTVKRNGTVNQVTTDRPGNSRFSERML